MSKYILFKSRLNGFFEWWLTGLLYFLPENTREKVQPTPNELRITFNGDLVALDYSNVRKQQLIEERIFRQDNELEKADIVRWLNELKGNNVTFTLNLPKEKVLSKTLVLPLTAESNLEEILSFEMDRQTPFTIDKVYHDHKITRRDQDNEKLHIELFVVLRNYVAPLLDEINSWQIRINKINTESRAAINLLPRELRPSMRRQFGKLSIVALIACITLFFAVLYFPILQQQRIEEELKAELNKVRIQAKQAQVLIKERDSILARTQFLSEKRNKQTPIIDLIKELTHILPDNTWINRLIIRADEIQLHGESNTATAIIQTLENSNLLEKAQFRSPVTKNNATQKDKFHVSTKILTGQVANGSN